MSDNILKLVDTPDDLKKLDIEQLKLLGDEVRDFIINNVLITGGHLASNLGVVELTIALHFCFDFLQDNLIFDVSHQCYTHKILTGRKNEFKNLRQFNGISGFTNIHESAYDKITVGHVGHSISNSIGMSLSRDMNNKIEKYNKNSQTVAVIGDASIANGYAFEALNYAGEIKKNLMVILNDNVMSISDPVGGFNEYLHQLRILPFYQEFKKDLDFKLNKLPVVGEKIKKLVEKIKGKIKHSIYPKTIFEELGFEYFGPIDGHDTELMIKTFNMLKHMPGPILVHVLTTKGKGLAESEDNPTKFHGIGPNSILKENDNKELNKSKKIDRESKPIESPPLTQVKSYTDTFAEGLIKLAKEKNNIVAITAAMPDGTGLSKFEKVHPDRFFDVGICESLAVGMAAGMALEKTVPYVAIYSTFLQRSYDQIMHDVCLQNSHVVFCLDRAGFAGNDGATHHGMFDIAYFRSLPNTILMSPKDNTELIEMLEFAYNLEGAVAIRYPRDSAPKPDYNRCDFTKLELGKAEIIKEGSDIALLAYGSMVSNAIAASELLEKQGISSAVINARFAKPIDKELIFNLLDEDLPIFTIEEHNLDGGFGSAVLEAAEEYEGRRFIRRIGIKNTFIEQGNRSDLLQLTGLNPASISNFVANVFSKIALKTR